MIYTQNGRGNNWALGYSDTYKEKADDENLMFDSALELLRKRSERMSYFRGTLLFHSLAGGTGSGLGSRLVESYRDYFGTKSVLMTASVWPSQSGETPLQ